MIKDTPALLKIVAKQHDEQLSIIGKKNRDYAGSNPFENFETTADFASISMDQSFLYQIVNKVTRAKNLLSKPASVENESLEDTLIDLANYTNLWLAYRMNK
jgi:hypothetical protein